MKILLASLVFCAGIFAQGTGTAAAQGTCNATNSGNNATVTITCLGVDKNLAGQITQLVAASKRDGKTLKDISDKVAELLKLLQNQFPVSGSISQSNSGGINIQQGTTGTNSPIINSPITVGDVPRSIQPSDKIALAAFVRGATKKTRVQISADQVSGVTPLPDDCYDVLKDGGWIMVDAGVNHYMGFAAPGRRFQGVVLTIKGDPLGPNEYINVDHSDPLYYLGRALEALRVPRSLTRYPKMEEGLININFEGGFPK